MEKAKEIKMKAIGQVDSKIATVRHKLEALGREEKGAQDAIDRCEHTYEWVEGAKK